MIKNTLKQTKFEDKTVKSTQPSLVLTGLHEFLIFLKPYGACVKRGSGKHMFGLSLFRPSRQSNISTSGEPGEQDQSNALPQGQQRQSNPHPMPCLPPRRLYIERCIMRKNSLQPGNLHHPDNYDSSSAKYERYWNL